MKVLKRLLVQVFVNLALVGVSLLALSLGTGTLAVSLPALGVTLVALGLELELYVLKGVLYWGRVHSHYRWLSCASTSVCCALVDPRFPGLEFGICVK